METIEVIARRKLHRFFETIEHSRTHCPDPRRFPIEVTVHAPFFVTRIEFFFSGVRGMFEVFLQTLSHEIPYIDYIYRDDEEGRVCIRLYPDDDVFKQIAWLYRSTINQVADDFIEKLINSRKSKGPE